MASSRCLLSLLLLLLLLSETSAWPYGNDRTFGFLPLPLNSSNFDIQRPYDLPVNERYSLVDFVHRLWVYNSDKHHSPNEPDYSSYGNTHTPANQRRRSNHIGAIRIDGSSVEDPLIIEQTFVDYITRAFKKPRRWQPEWRDEDLGRVPDYFQRFQRIAELSVAPWGRVRHFWAPQGHTGPGQYVSPVI
ncbi:Citrate-binding protein [Acorus calamus]|uniref:Citrate-binding protein n=1 Tax=Acorus calamus TaxID=4465 RepID=A0AAV9EBC3_ACOCL|nr:Citrate-binding protein [Acorus calamus]